MIKAAQRYEVHSAHSQVHSVMDSYHNKQWKPAALHHDMTKQRVYNPPSSLQSTDTDIEPPRPFSRPRAKSDFHSKPKSNVNTKTATEICFAYNKRPKAYCELPSNECKYGRQHKCQTCNMWGCKRINHRVPEPQAHVANTNSDQCSINSTDSTVNQIKGLLQNMNQSVQFLSTRMEKLEAKPSPAPSAVSSLSDPPPPPPNVLYLVVLLFLQFPVTCKSLS